MSDHSDPFGFGKLVPGFDFLQNLMDQSGKASGRGSAAKLPGLSGWIAPTLNVEELDRRISELKAVSFWLDQNAKALAATVQALEVQKMTLATLAGMNVAIGDVAKAFQVKPAAQASDKPPANAKRRVGAPAHEGWPLSADAASKPTGNPYEQSFQSGNEPAARPAVAAAPAPAAASAPAAADPGQPGAAEPAAGSAAAPGLVDPMQWWGALTSQFQQIAANAMRDAGSGNPALAASRELAGAALKNANRMAASIADAAKPRAGTAAKKKAAPRRGTAASKTTTAGAGRSPRKTATKRASRRA